jgi:hypothetical protein
VSYQPTPKEARVLWSLLITKEELAISKIRPKFRIKDAAPLVATGLMTLEKIGSTTYVILTDKAWDWASEEFDLLFSAKTTAAVSVPGKLLEAIGQYINAHNIPISEILAQHPTPEITPALMIDIDSRVREAYLALSGGRYAQRVRLSQLRNYFDDCPRLELDEALIRMMRDDRLTLMRLDDPLEIEPEDEKSALVSGGQQNHILYMKAW